MVRTQIKNWIIRATPWLDQEFETHDWVARLIINETGQLTSTNEFVYRYGIAKARREQDTEQSINSSGEWSPEREQELTNDEAATRTVTKTLEDLAVRGLIEQVEADDTSNSDQTFWRLTEKGEQEQDRLEQQYQLELEQLQLEFGMTTQW